MYCEYVPAVDGRRHYDYDMALNFDKTLRRMDIELSIQLSSRLHLLLSHQTRATSKMFLPISVLETRMHFRFYVYVEEAGNPSVIQLSAVKATSSEKRGKIQTTKRPNLDIWSTKREPNPN